VALQGKLEDMPVVDVLQFIYASRRSGTLYLESRDRRGFVVFRDGNIGQASTNAAENNLGSILMAKGLIKEGELARAVAAQRLEYKGTPLGRVLVEMGLLAEEQVKSAVVDQIEAAVRDFVLWLDGDFVFELGAGGEPPGDVAVSVEGLLPGVNVDTQHLLLECIRIFDERNKAAAGAAPGEREVRPAAEVTPPEEIEAPAPPKHTVYLYSDKEDFYALLASVAANKNVECRAFQSFTELMLAVEGVMRGDRLPVVVLDVDFASASARQGDAGRAGELLSKLKGASRAADVVCVADVRNFVRELWTVVVESLRNYELVYVKRQWRERISSLESYLLKLKKFVREAQRSDFTFLVSLDLLNIISENYERALLFVVREGRAYGIGGFGDADDGTPLGIVAKNVEIPLDGASVFRSVADRRATFRGKPDPGQPAHSLLFEKIGKPKSGDAVVVPLISRGRTLAMVYCDNGASDAPLVYDELLDLLSNQTNILYERMLAETLPQAASE